MDAELDEQFDKVAELMRPDSDVHKAFIEMRKLMRLFYEYLKAYRE